jgi:hypothetical protein
MMTKAQTALARNKAGLAFHDAAETHRMLARTKKCGFFWPASPSGEAWDKTYKEWMIAKAEDGDRFALSLGYGSSITR